VPHLLRILPVFPATPRPPKFLIRFGKAAYPRLLPLMQRCSTSDTTLASCLFRVASSSGRRALKSVRINTFQAALPARAACSADIIVALSILAVKTTSFPSTRHFPGNRMPRPRRFAKNALNSSPRSALDHATLAGPTLTTGHKIECVGSCGLKTTPPSVHARGGDHEGVLHFASINRRESPNVSRIRLIH